MKQNSLIEIGSKGDVVLKFNTKTFVNGKCYEPNEPYIFLRDVNVIINYGSENKSATKQQALAAHSNIYPESVSVTGVPFSRRVASLLSTYSDSGSSFKKSEMKSAVPVIGPEGVDVLIVRDLIDKDFVLYTDEMEKVDPESYTFDTEKQMIEGSGVISAAEGYSFNHNKYIIFFYSDVNGTRFKLDKPHIPYMTMEIQGVGNINKRNAQVLMRFEKVSLNSVLNFNFLEEGIIGAPLNFTIIKGENEIWFEDNE